MKDLRVFAQLHQIAVRNFSADFYAKLSGKSSHFFESSLRFFICSSNLTIKLVSFIWRNDVRTTPLQTCVEMLPCGKRICANSLAIAPECLCQHDPFSKAFSGGRLRCRLDRTPLISRMERSSSKEEDALHNTEAYHCGLRRSSYIHRQIYFYYHNSECSLPLFKRPFASVMDPTAEVTSQIIFAILKFHWKRIQYV